MDKEPNQINTRLLDILAEMVKEEKKADEYKKRMRMRGIITKKSLTKNRNITLSVSGVKGDCIFTVIKTHKERFALAQKLTEGNSISIEGISKFRICICTRIRQLEKPIEKARQQKLAGFAR